MKIVPSLQNHQRAVAHVRREFMGGRLDHVHADLAVGGQRRSYWDDAGVAAGVLVEFMCSDEFSRFRDAG